MCSVSFWYFSQNRHNNQTGGILLKEKCGKEKILRVFVCAIVIASVLPVLRASSLATFRTDDFSFALQYGSEKGNLFIRAFNSTLH